MTETQELASKMIDSLNKEGITNYTEALDYLSLEFNRRAEVCDSLGDYQGSKLMNRWSDWFSEFSSATAFGNTPRPDLAAK